MMQRIEHEDDRDGILITSVSSTDKTIEVPAEMDGRPVVSIGPRFLVRSQGVQGRVLRIPASVVRMDPDALEGAVGITSIEYGGDISTFSSFGLTSANDCGLVCGDGFSFDFKGGVPMSFPDYDKVMLSFASGLTLENAIARITKPACLSEENLEGYKRFISDRIMPRAERAIAAGDSEAIKELLSTGMIGDDDLKRLLQRSARSGKIAVTSMLMSVISSRFYENK